MVTIRVFIPTLKMQNRIEEAVKRLPPQDDIKIDLAYIFGTPESLKDYGDAEIMVARGMTYDRLKDLFPERHLVEIQLTSFDILNALIEAKRSFSPRRIALCVRNIEIEKLSELEILCEAEVRYYHIREEKSTYDAIEKGMQWGADVFVGAGTLCGVCDEKHLNRVHIYTKDKAIDSALEQAMRAAKTINLERARSHITALILNSSSDAMIVVNGEGYVWELNNQAYRMFQVPSQMNMKGRPIQEICGGFSWREAAEDGVEKQEIILWEDKRFYVEYKPIVVDKMGKGAIIMARRTEQIMEAETKIRESLANKGLTARYSFDDILGSSAAIQEDIAVAKRYSQVDSNVLIVGETGTGKELFAHSIHRSSRRSSQPFVALNCAALPENLLESELFGYEPGAFSGASKNGKAGLFELAHKGTIFLDEIGELPIALQAKLLRVLQEKEIRRIGGSQVKHIDVRIISATNINMREKIKEGQFRADLYYRLDLLDLVIPPLRDRKEDIHELMDFYLTRFACEMRKPIPRLSEDAVKMIDRYSWPGNVRELRNICERLVVLCDSEKIERKDIERLRIFRSMEGDKNRESVNQETEGERFYKGFKPKKKKQEIAKELGVSRTTLWRMEKMAKEIKNQKEEE